MKMRAGWVVGIAEHVPPVYRGSRRLTEAEDPLSIVRARILAKSTNGRKGAARAVQTAQAEGPLWVVLSCWLGVQGGR
jgi:hypothetical protein